jgi:hypothetical protein
MGGQVEEQFVLHSCQSAVELSDVDLEQSSQPLGEQFVWQIWKSVLKGSEWGWDLRQRSGARQV